MGAPDTSEHPDETVTAVVEIEAAPADKPVAEEAPEGQTALEETPKAGGCRKNLRRLRARNRKKKRRKLPPKLSRMNGRGREPTEESEKKSA